MVVRYTSRQKFANDEVEVGCAGEICRGQGSWSARALQLGRGLAVQEFSAGEDVMTARREFAARFRDSHGEQ